MALFCAAIRRESVSLFIIIYSFRVFHISDIWWFLTGVWVTANLLKSPGLFSVFWSFSIMLSFGWSPLIRQLPSHPVPLIILNNPLVTVPKAPITIGIIGTFIFHSSFNSLARSRYLSFFSHFSVFFCGQPGQQSRQFCKFSFFCWLGDPCVCQSPIGVYVCYNNYSLIRDFHISVSRWVFTGVWVTASLLKSPGLFSVFWPFSIMLSFEWSPLVHQPPTPPAPLVIL